MPKALHIYLWKQFWGRYGRGFDFAQTFAAMPESLHAWFMSMFKYAGDAATAHVIDDILRPDGIFSQCTTLMSDKGSEFLSILAEANPAAVLRLLESTVGQWSDQKLLDFSEHRQNLVWTLEKIAVWPALTGCMCCLASAAICRCSTPVGAWTIVRTHLEETLPKWRGDLLHWLKGGLATFDEKYPRGAVIDLPVPEILEWIEKDPEPRAVLMAHAVPGTLDEKQGGRLTQALLSRYGQLEGVRNGISATFHSGGWSGPTSAYLKRKRDKLRRWLAAGFDSQTIQWIEVEIEDLDRRIEREEIDEERSRFE